MWISRLAQEEKMIKLRGGPHDGLDVTALAGNHVHFFVFIRRSQTFSFYTRAESGILNEEDFRYESVIPCGAIGVVITVG